MNIEEHRQSVNDTFRALVRELEKHNPARKGHGERVSVYAVATGCELGMEERELYSLRLAALVHDASKLLFPRELLEREGPLTGDELLQIRRGAEAFAQHAQLLGSGDILDVLAKQYAWWNGDGFPQGLGGENIPLPSRIILVSAAFDVMVTEQPWQPARSEDDALKELRQCSGAQFDPQVIEAFAAVQPLIQPVRNVF